MWMLTGWKEKGTDGVEYPQILMFKLILEINRIVGRDRHLQPPDRLELIRRKQSNWYRRHLPCLLCRAVSRAYCT
ncbi:unnamed protein product [Caenorhabditis brenneri]